MVDLGIPGIVDLKPVGQGGSAIVYRGRQKLLDRLVAIKVLRQSWDERSKVRFDRERRAMGRLSEDAGIVPIYDADETPDGDPYFVMPYYERGSLQSHIDTNGAFHWERAVELIEKVAETISMAHAADVVHRDIKPANLLLDRNSMPLVGDFGIARITSDSAGANTQSAFFTPAFSPPELFKGAGASTPNVDVYGMGATLWALLAGHAPFIMPDEKIDSVKLLHRVKNERVGDLRVTVPGPVCAVVEKAMAKLPGERHQTAEAFLTDLRRARRKVLDNYAQPDKPVVDEETTDKVNVTDTIDLTPNRMRSSATNAGGAVAGLAAKHKAEGTGGPDVAGGSWQPPPGQPNSRSAVSAIQRADLSILSRAARSETSNRWMFIGGGCVLASVLLVLIILQLSIADSTETGSDQVNASDRADVRIRDDEGVPVVPVEEMSVVEPISKDVAVQQAIVLADEFNSGPRSLFDGDGPGSPLRVRTGVSELTGNSATVWVETDQCSVARFFGVDRFATLGWPSYENCAYGHYQDLTGLEPGKTVSVVITASSESTRAVRTRVSFTPPAEGEAGLEVSDLKVLEQTTNSLLVAFTTSECAEFKATVFGLAFASPGWEALDDASCHTEHQLLVPELRSNSIYDVQIEAQNKRGEPLSVGLTASTLALPDQGTDVPIVLTFAADPGTGRGSVPVRADLSTCGDVTFILRRVPEPEDSERTAEADPGLLQPADVLPSPGCVESHEREFKNLEVDRPYELIMIARNEFGESEPRVQTFRSPAFDDAQTEENARIRRAEAERGAGDG